jgi:dTDP-4-dehydrorhamnose reductase
MESGDKKKRVFITGGNGQLGRALFHFGANRELYLGDYLTDDITSKEIVRKIVDFNPDMVIHAAALTDVDACERQPEQAFLVNEQGTRHVVEGANRAGAVLVYVSTDYVFDGKKETPYRETDSIGPINVYGQSKLAGEAVTRKEADRWIIARTSWVYGEGQKSFVRNLLEWAKMEPPLRLVADKVGSPTCALDLAGAIVGLVERGVSNRVFHVSGEGSCNWVEYGREILTIAGIDKEIIPICFDELKRPARRPSYSVLSNEALCKEGLGMRPWQVALKEFMMRPACSLTEVKND